MSTYFARKRSVPIMIGMTVVLSFSGVVSAEEEHDAHEGEQEVHEEGIDVSANVLKEFGIETTEVSAGTIQIQQRLNGEIALIPRNVVHVAPPVEGIVRNVLKSLGDYVEEGDLLATLTSRELATARAELLAAISKQKLAATTYVREKNLFEKKISAESDYLAAEQGLAAARIDVDSAKHRLLALGLQEEEYKRGDSHDSLTAYSLTAAASGFVVEKHITRGELVGPNSRSFVIADLSNVWVELTVYQKDLDLIREGQTVLIGDADADHSAQGVIEYISPIIESSTRSTTARVVIENAKRQWKPGMFIVASIVIDSASADVVVPISAVQSIAGKPIVFLQHEGRFESRDVTLGGRDRENVEVLGGLKVGDVVATTNSFTLKAELQKSEFGDGHGH